MGNDLKVFKGNCNTVTDLSVLQMNSLVRLSLISLQYSYIIQSCTSHLLWEAYLAYPGGRINHYTIQWNNPFFFPWQIRSRQIFVKILLNVCMYFLKGKSNSTLKSFMYQSMSTISVQLYLKFLIQLQKDGKRNQASTETICLFGQMVF